MFIMGSIPVCVIPMPHRRFVGVFFAPMRIIHTAHDRPFLPLFAVLYAACGREFCDSQIRKVVETTLTFGPQDSRRWRDCAADFVDVSVSERILLYVYYCIRGSNLNLFSAFGRGASRGGTAVLLYTVVPAHSQRTPISSEAENLILPPPLSTDLYIGFSVTPVTEPKFLGLISYFVFFQQI